MSQMFSISEIFQFAIKIEENGEKFYKAVAQKIKEHETKTVFLILAEEEVRHRQIYEKMLSEIESYKPEEIYPEEYFLYLKAYVDNIIFSDKKLDEFLKFNINIDLSYAIDYAMQKEVESILYYIEIKKFVSKEQSTKVDKIIEEERRHYLKLQNLKKEISK